MEQTDPSENEALSAQSLFVCRHVVACSAKRNEAFAEDDDSCEGRTSVLLPLLKAMFAALRLEDLAEGLDICKWSVVWQQIQLLFLK